MNNRRLKFSVLGVIIVFLGGVYFFHDPLTHRLLEWMINQQTKEIFHHTVKIDQGRINGNLHFHLKGIRAELRSKNETVFLSLDAIENKGPLWAPLAGMPLTVEWKNLKTAQAREPGIYGFILLQGSDVEVTAVIKSLSFQDLTWMDPEHLKGSTGNLSGWFKARFAKGSNPSFSLKVQSGEQGGRLPAGFFDLLLPYLPPTTQVRLNKLSSAGRLIDYQKAELVLTTLSADTIKAQIHLQIPDYLLNLNVNADIRTDKENAFFELAQLLGILQGK